MKLRMRLPRSLAAALVLLAAVSLAPGEARAAEDWNPIDEYWSDELGPYVRGIGTDHFVSMAIGYMPSSVVDFEENDIDPPIAGSSYFTMAASMVPLPTLFGSLGGAEADLTLGFPLFRSYFGGIGGNFGLVVQPISFRYLRASVAFGAGFNAHGYGYLKPRVAFTLVPDWIDAEATYRWIPEYASNVFGREDGLEDVGFGEHKFRGNLFVRVGAKQGGDDFAIATSLHLFFEYTRLKGDEKELAGVRIRPGDYMTFGLGLAF